MRSYPVEPILEMFDSIDTCAAAFGTEPRTVYRWVQQGGVSVAVADRLAGELGVHPADVWPSWWDDALEDTEELDAHEARRRANLGAVKHKEPEWQPVLPGL